MNTPANNLDPKSLEEFLEGLDLAKGVDLKGCNVEVALSAVKEKR